MSHDPRFVQKQEPSESVEATTLPDDGYWDNGFARPGPGTIFALVFSNGGLYVGGSFKIAGGTFMNNIAKWDGAKWTALGDGVDDTVRGIAVKGNDVYVCGDFLHAGGKEANAVARWDGTSWSALGDGIDGTIFALAANGGNLYAAGQFAKAGLVNAKDIARWNGKEWSALGSGVNFNDFPGFALAVTVFKGDLYVGGLFDTAGGKPSYGFARWTGPADLPPSPVINAVSISGKKLFVVGQNFDQGATILINGEEQKTANDADTPGTKLIAKKAGKKVKAGDKLRVKNTDGSLSAELPFPG